MDIRGSSGSSRGVVMDWVDDDGDDDKEDLISSSSESSSEASGGGGWLPFVPWFSRIALESDSA